MTRWSRHDPVMLSLGCSDHWAKMRIRAAGNNGKPLQKDPFPAKEQRLASVTLYKQAPAPAAHLGDGRVDCVANGIASQVPLRDLHGNIPGNYASPNYGGNSAKSGKVNARSVTFNNVYHQRAKSGHEYWYKERPKPTSFGRYGFGSYKTLLGLGSAPRT